MAGFRRALAPGSRLGLSTWGVEDERWSWEDELFGDLVVERRAVRRPFSEAGDLETLLHGGGFDDVVVHAEHHEVMLPGPEEWRAWKWSYSLRGVLEQMAPSRLQQLQRDADAPIAAMRADTGGSLALRLEALFVLGHGMTGSMIATPG